MPGFTWCGEMEVPGMMSPMPAVLMKMPSALPRSTTFVSPVTMAMPASSAISRIVCAILRRSSMRKPSSRIMPTEM